MDSSLRDEVADECLAGGGEAGALMRQIDWSKSPLGPVRDWPQTLRTTIGIVLASRFAMRVLWGPEFIFLYNDAYRPILGATKHPSAMGSRTAESFREVWDIVGPLFRQVLEGEASVLRDGLLPLDRNGYREECYFTLSYSPLSDDKGGVGGVLGVVTETTERVLAERRLSCLRELAAGTAESRTPAHACQIAAEVLAKNPQDFPFALFYLTDTAGLVAELAAKSGLGHHAAAPFRIELSSSNDKPTWPLAVDANDSGVGGALKRLSDLKKRFGEIHAGPYPEPVETAVILPLLARGHSKPYGFFVGGVNPRRRVDDAYLGVFELARGQIVSAISQATSRATLERARIAAERTAQRMSRLQAITGQLSAAVTPQEVAAIVVREAGSASGADGAGLWGMNADGALAFIAGSGGSPTTFAPYQLVTRDSDRPLAEILRSRKPFFVESRAEHDRLWAAESKPSRQLPEGVHAYVAIPLLVETRTVGFLALIYRDAHPFDEEDRVFALTLGNQCAQSLERARLYEAAQNAVERAGEASRAKDEFLAIVSHELRNPLSAILGWTRLLRSGALSPDKSVRALETIERNALNQAQLIDDLLDVSRIVSGKLRLDVQPIDLVRIIEAAVESARPAIDAKQIRLKTMLNSHQADLMGDATRLQQVFWNLLTNATKFAPKGGLIEVILRRIDSHLELSVSDNGVGMPPELVPRVFDRFKQADSSSTRKYGGLGLGLAISKTLVEAHGGTIEARSDGEGRGATFLVQLPIWMVARAERERLRKENQLAPLSGQTPPELVGLRVLGVDDQEDARDLIVAVLGQCGAAVTVASSVAEAMSILETSPPDVILSDIGLPDEDGQSFIRRVRARSVDKGGMIPAACLTAYASAEDRRRFLTAGFTIHISKPVDPTELVAVVANLARIAKAIRPS